jgi:hypothetical protein
MTTTPSRPTRRVLLSAALLSAAGCVASGQATDPAQRTFDTDTNGAALAAAPAHASCPGVTLRTRAELQALRSCREIAGDLVIEPADFTALTAADLPDLRRITGSLVAFGATRLEELTLPALVAVGTTGHGDMIDIGYDAETLQHVSLPALEVVHGDLVVAVALQLRELDLPNLRDIDGRLDLLTLPELRALDMRAAVRASDSVAIEHVCRLPADRLLDVTSASGDVDVRGIGCCTQSAIGCPTSACACE